MAVLRIGYHGLEPLPFTLVVGLKLLSINGGDGETGTRATQQERSGWRHPLQLNNPPITKLRQELGDLMPQFWQ